VVLEEIEVPMSWALRDRGTRDADGSLCLSRRIARAGFVTADEF